jgi:hypothetical protein
VRKVETIFPTGEALFVGYTLAGGVGSRCAVLGLSAHVGRVCGVGWTLLWALGALCAGRMPDACLHCMLYVCM